MLRIFSFLKKVHSDTQELPVGIKLIVFVIFLRMLGWGFVDPFYSIFIDSFSDSYAGIGSMVAIYNFASLFALIPLFRLADKVRDTTIMRDGEVIYLFAIVFYILAGLTGEIGFLIPALIFSGIASPFVIVGAETYIRKHVKIGGETKSFAFYTALHYLGWITGMLIGAFTVQYYGLTWMFLFILPSIFAGLFILNRIKERGIRSMLRGLKKYLHTREDFRNILTDLQDLNSRTSYFLLLAFFDGVITMFSFVFIPLFALSIDLGFKEIALLMAVMYLPFIFTFLISEATDKLKRMNVIAMGLFIGGISFISLSLIVDQLWIVLFVVLKSFSLAIIRPTYNGMITHLTPRRMLGEMTGLNNIAIRAGFIVGPILSGFIADKFSIQVAFFGMAIFAFTLATVTLLFKGLGTLITND